MVDGGNRNQQLERLENRRRERNITSFFVPVPFSFPSRSLFPVLTFTAHVRVTFHIKISTSTRRDSEEDHAHRRIQGTMYSRLAYRSASPAAWAAARPALGALAATGNGARRTVAARGALETAKIVASSSALVTKPRQRASLAGTRDLCSSALGAGALLVICGGWNPGS